MNEDTQKLVERIEAATGPDRALDAEIEIAVAGFPERAYQQRNGMRAKGTPPLDRMEWLRGWGVLSFTGSIDAAITLVPDDHTVQLSDWDHPILRAKGKWQAIILPLGARGGMKEYTFTNRCDHAATLPLAICAAALRARPAQL